MKIYFATYMTSCMGHIDKDIIAVIVAADEVEARQQLCQGEHLHSERWVLKEIDTSKSGIAHWESRA